MTVFLHKVVEGSSTNHGNSTISRLVLCLRLLLYGDFLYLNGSLRLPLRFTSLPTKWNRNVVPVVHVIPTH